MEATQNQGARLLGPSMHNPTSFDPTHQSQTPPQQKNEIKPLPFLLPTQMTFSPAQIQQTQLVPLAPHAMPIPSNAPWSLNTMPWTLASVDASQERVMQFNASKGLREEYQRIQLHQKRKTDTPGQPTQPPKQFVSEEMITAHFNGLHISSDYIQSTGTSTTALGDYEIEKPSTSGKCFTNLTYQDYKLTAKELEDRLRNARRITICEEVKKLQQESQSVPFLPHALLNHIEKPCRALVLWQPPQPLADLIRPHPQRKSQKNNEDEDENGKKNKNDQSSCDSGIQDVALDVDYEDVSELSDVEEYVDIEDFMDNNNTCAVDLNNVDEDEMDEDL